MSTSQGVTQRAGMLRTGRLIAEEDGPGGYDGKQYERHTSMPF
ncbi:hypothetical protein [Paenibacillus xerothermodurans]|nr:hypothetical protein [Paenibacillus xerothermodurans]